MAKTREFEIAGAGDRLSRHQSGGGRPSLLVPEGLSYWKPKKEGTHMIEIIPYLVTDSMKRFHSDYRYAEPGQWYYERTYFVHRGIGVNNDSYPCAAKTFGKPCPMCEHVVNLKKMPDKESREQAYALRQSERQLFLIYDLDAIEKGVQLWEVAHFNFGKHLDAYIEGARPKDKEKYRKFYHPTKGFTLRLNAVEAPIGKGDEKGGGKNTTYFVHQFYDREADIPDAIIDHGFDLDAMVRQYEYDAMKKIYTGVVDDDGDDDAPPSRTVSRRNDDDGERRPSRNGTGDDDGERRPARARDEDDEPPPRAKAKPTAKPQDDDDAPPTRKSAAKERDPDPEDPVVIGSEDVVSFERRGEVLEGVVKSVDLERDIARVEVEGFDRPVTVDIPDLTLLKRFDGFDAKPEPKAKAKALVDDPDDDLPPPKVKPLTAAVPSKRRWEEDDENDAEKSFRPKPGEDDDLPPPKAKAATKRK